MNNEKKFKTIGILGGMGPMATVECFKSIVENAPAESDQEHPPVFVNNKPQIPDRTASILNNGESPVPLLQTSAKKLEKVDSDFIIFPCNTAHHYIDDIRESVDIPVLNMIKTTIEKIPKGSDVGLLATKGTIETGIYQKYAKDKVNIITPDEEYQDIFMEVIYGDEGVKAGFYDDELTKKMLKVADHLKNQGANNIIAGCTEVRLILSDSDLENSTLFTPIDVISKRAIQIALGNQKL